MLEELPVLRLSSCLACTGPVSAFTEHRPPHSRMWPPECTILHARSHLENICRVSLSWPSNFETGRHFWSEFRNHVVSVTAARNLSNEGFEESLPLEAMQRDMLAT